MTFDFLDLKYLFEQIPSTAVKSIVAEIYAHPRIFIHGSGRSGLMLKAFAMRLAQIGFTVYVVGEVVTPSIQQGDLLIVASASGKTASVLHYVQVAQNAGAYIYTITATPNAPLVTYSNSCIFINAPTKDSCDASSVMGTLFEQTVLLFCDYVVESMGMDTAKMREHHANLE